MAATAVEAPKRATPPSIEHAAHTVWEVMQREVSKRGLARTKHKPLGDGRITVGTIGSFIKVLNDERGWKFTKTEVDQIRRYLKVTGNVVVLEKVEQYRFRIFVRETWSNEPVLPEKDHSHVGKSPEEKVTPEEAGETRPPAPVSLRNTLTSRNRAVLNDLAELGGHVEDKLGHVAPVVAEKAGFPRNSVSAALRALECGGFVTRDVRGKRTYEVKVTSAGWKALDRTPPAESGQNTVIRTLSKPEPDGEDTAPRSGGTLAEVPDHDLLEELRARLTSPDELAACRARLDVIRDLVGEVNAGTLAPLKALADIEVAVDL